MTRASTTDHAGASAPAAGRSEDRLGTVADHAGASAPAAGRSGDRPGQEKAQCAG